MGMNVDSLTIEITRRCNMKCGHCIRGNAQPIDFDIKYFRDFIEKNNITGISDLFFTGGEPSLKVDLMRQVLDYMKKKDIYLNRFGMVTNGKRATDEFIHLLIDYHLFCQDDSSIEDGGSYIEISNDMWHDENGQSRDAIARLKTLRFVRQRDRLNPHHVICDGRAKLQGWGEIRTDLYTRDYFGEMSEYGDWEGVVYINALGFFIPHCDLPYSAHKKLALGHASYISLAELDKIRKQQKNTAKLIELKRPEPILEEAA